MHHLKDLKSYMILNGGEINVIMKMNLKTYYI